MIEKKNKSPNKYGRVESQKRKKKRQQRRSKIFN